MSGNIPVMPSCPWVSFVTWLEGKERLFPTVCSTMLPVLVLAVMSMVDTLGLPTIFFTHSAADLQWPELARLISPEDQD